MLVLLRSDFRMEAHRQAFYRLLRYAHYKSDNLFEIPVMEAPTPAAIAIRLRNVKPQRNMLLCLGTCRNESLSQTLSVLREIRNFIPYISILPTIIIARESEWRNYEQASAGTECFELSEPRVLIIQQMFSYSDLAQRMTLAYLLPKDLGSKSAETRPAEATTQQFMLGDRPSSSHQVITDDMLAQAGIKTREDEPTAEVPIGEDDRITELPPPPKFDSGKKR